MRRALLYIMITILIIFSSCIKPDHLIFEPKQITEFISINLILYWGENGLNEGQFGGHPLDIAIDSNNRLYITDVLYVHVFNKNGGYLYRFSSDNSRGITIDSNDNVYVCDFVNGCVYKYDRFGTLIDTIGDHGSSEGNFIGPCDCKVFQNKLYVLDYFNKHISRFSLDGQYIDRFYLGADTHAVEMEINQFGDFFLVDQEAYEIKIFNNKGKIKNSFKIRDTNGDLTFPRGIALDKYGYLYVTMDHEIKRYTPSGIDLYSWGNFGSGEGDFDTPLGIILDSKSNIYICDALNYRIKKYQISTIP